MSWTQQDLDKLSTSIAGGILEVRYADGRLVRYQSAGEMMQVRDKMKGELAAAASQVNPRVRFTRARMQR